MAFVNSVVHPAVRDDIVQWSVQQDKAPAFVETAILQESGLDAMVDEVWIVTAPVEVFRYALLGQGTIVPWALAWSWAFTLIVVIFGIMIFNRIEKTFMDTV